MTADEANELQKDRVDLIKRLFAVAISVGFATQISSILHEQNNHPDLYALVSTHGKGLLLLVASVCVVVGSWEGYLASVRSKPLDDAIRFYLDIVLVFGYLLLMLTSELPQIWFGVHFAIFVVYLIWDVFAEKYVRSHPDSPEAKSLANPRPYQRSIVITAVWTVCSAVLALFNNTATTIGSICAAIAAVLIVVFYRWDKKDRRTAPWNFGKKAIAAAVTVAIIFGSRLL